ncbi:MAG: ATP-binding cassette domain-containing protein [Anaerolineae bacterium]
MSASITAQGRVVESGESAWARYARATVGACALSLMLIAGALLITLGEGTSSRDLLANQFLINAIMVVGLQVFIGNTGIMSFGHMGFATIAGYIVALLTMPVNRKMLQIPDAPFGIVHLNFPPGIATLIAVGVVVLFALLLSGALTRSGQGAFAATIITLALLLIVHEAATSWIELTDGASGLGFIPRLENRTPIFVALVASVIVARIFGETHLGRWAQASREDSVAAEVLGMDARKPRAVALIISVAIVAVGASLKVQDVGAMTPRVMYFDATLVTLAMLVAGGRESVTGALLGVVLITAGNEFCRVAGSNWDIPGLGWLLRPTLTQLFLGAVMLGTMLLKPEGLIVNWELDYLLLRRRRQKEQRPAAPQLSGVRGDGRKTHVLKADNLTVDFGRFRALNRVTIEARSNEIVGVIGPNGAGKTTLINAITGFVHTTEGTVTLDGQLLTGKQPYQIAKAGIARTFQNLRLFKGLSVRENVAVAAITNEYLDHRDPDAYTSQLLVSANLWEQRYALATEVDSGSQRRLELARAAARSPRFLLLDEPTSGMNDDESAKMVDHIRKIADSLNAGVIVIDHDLRFITRICDRVYVLDYGTLLASGTPAEIRANEAVRVAYLGTN